MSFGQRVLGIVILIISMALVFLSLSQIFESPFIYFARIRYFTDESRLKIFIRSVMQFIIWGLILGSVLAIELCFLQNYKKFYSIGNALSFIYSLINIVNLYEEADDKALWELARMKGLIDK